MSEIIVTIVHDDRDCIKYQLKILRDGLKHVTPRVNFKSCCVWEFTDNIFDQNRAVLVILTKQCKPFRHKVLESFQRYRDRCRKVECRVCVVFEVEGCAIKESAIDRDNATEVEANRRSTDFESVIGNKNCAMIKAGECSNEKNRTVPKAEGGNIVENAESVTDKENVAVVHAHRGSTEETFKSVAEKANVIIVQAYNEMINEDLGCVPDKDNVAHNNEADDETVMEDLGSVKYKETVSIDEADDETVVEDLKRATSQDNSAVVKSEGSNTEDRFESVSHKGCNVLIEAWSGPVDVNLKSVKGKEIIGTIEGDGETIKEDFESLTGKETVAVIEEDNETIKRNFESITGKENIIFVEPYDETIQEDLESVLVKENVFVVEANDETSRRDFASVNVKENNAVDADIEEDFENIKCNQNYAEVKADGDGIKEAFEVAIGKDNVVMVEDLHQSVKWLPKVCTFLFQTKRRKMELNCVIPSVRDHSDTTHFRKDLLKGLRELDIHVSESFDLLKPRCCILFKNVDDDYDLAPSVESIRSEKMIIKRVGGTIFEYKRSYTDGPHMQPSNEIVYGRNSLVLFIIHLLYVMEVINITTLLGNRLWRIKKSEKTTVDCARCDSPLETCSMLDCDCFSFVAFLLLSLFNPSLIFLFFTPFPYMSTMCCIERLRRFCLIWLVICSVAILGGVSYFLWTFGNMLHFYLFVYFGSYSLCISGLLQIKLLELNYKIEEKCFRCVAFLLLSFLNPSLIILFFTPFPSVVIKCCKKSLKSVCFIWLGICSIAIYGGVSYFLWTLENTLHFYLFVGIGCYSLFISGFLQIKLLKLSQKIAKMSLHRCIVFSFLLLFNPSLIICFFTPFPYVAIKFSNKEELKEIYQGLLIWFGIVSIAIYGGLAYLLWTLDQKLAFFFFLFFGWIPLVFSGLCQIKEYIF